MSQKCLNISSEFPRSQRDVLITLFLLSETLKQEILTIKELKLEQQMMNILT